MKRRIDGNRINDRTRNIKGLDNLWNLYVSTIRYTSAALRPIAKPCLTLLLIFGIAATIVSASARNCFCFAGDIDEFELVESIPIETNLDNLKIRNTPEVWLEMINGAKRSLEIEEFYISDAPGEPLEPILNAVADAGRRGVRVRVIVDSRMYQTYPERADWFAKQPNVGVRKLNMRNIGGGVMHAKYFVVDGTEVFLGSQNFDWRALKHIHEIGCRVKSQGFARVFVDLFELDWKLAQGLGGSLDISQPVNAKSGAGASKAQTGRSVKERIVSSIAHKSYRVPFEGLVAVPYPYGTVTPKYGSRDSIKVWPGYDPKGLIPDESLWDEPRIVELINGAKREVNVQLLTYSAISGKDYFPNLDDALRAAAARGVLVKLIASDWAKTHPEIDCLKSLCVIPNIQVKLSTIPQWSGGFVSYARVEHCKYLVVDDEMSWIGSSNWEKDYFYASRNVSVIVTSRAMAAMLREVFYKSWDSEYAYAVKPDVQYEPPKRSE